MIHVHEQEDTSGTSRAEELRAVHHGNVELVHR